MHERYKNPSNPPHHPHTCADVIMALTRKKTRRSSKRRKTTVGKKKKKQGGSSSTYLRRKRGGYIDGPLYLQRRVREVGEVMPRRTGGDGRKKKQRSKALTSAEFHDAIQRLTDLFVPESVKKMKKLESKISTSTQSPTPGKSSKQFRDRLQRERVAYMANQGPGGLNFSSPFTPMVGGNRAGMLPGDGTYIPPFPQRSKVKPLHQEQGARPKAAKRQRVEEEEDFDTPNLGFQTPPSSPSKPPGSRSGKSLSSPVDTPRGRPEKGARGARRQASHFWGDANVRRYLSDIGEENELGVRLYNEITTHIDPNTGMIDGEVDARPFPVLAYMLRPNETPPSGTGSFLKKYHENPKSAPATILSNGQDVSSPYIHSHKTLDRLGLTFKAYMQMQNKMKPDDQKKLLSSLKKLPADPDKGEYAIITTALSQRMLMSDSNKSPRKYVGTMIPRDFTSLIQGIVKTMRDT